MIMTSQESHLFDKNEEETKQTVRFEISNNGFYLTDGFVHWCFNLEMARKFKEGLEVYISALEIKCSQN